MNNDTPTTLNLTDLCGRAWIKVEAAQRRSRRIALMIDAIAAISICTIVGSITYAMGRGWL